MKIYNFISINAFTTYVFLIILIITTHVSAQCETSTDFTKNGTAKENALIVGFVRRELNDTTVANISWAAYTHIVIAYPDILNKGVTNGQYLSEPFIANLIKTARDTNPAIKIIAAFGNYGINTTATIWQEIRGNPVNTITQIKTYIDNHNIDGIDIEYPDAACDDRHTMGPNEYQAVFADLITQLQPKITPKFISVTAKPDKNQDFNNIINLNPDLVNWVNVIGYRLNIGLYPLSSTQQQGPTSPLINNQTAFFTFDKVVKDWTGTGTKFGSKIVMGIEFSGIVRRVDSDPSKSQQKVTVIDQLSFQNGQPIHDNCNNVLPNMNLVSWDNLTSLVSSNCQTNSGWRRGFDGTLSTYLTLRQKQQDPNLDTYMYISYEDQKSLEQKVRYIRNSPLVGVMIADISVDINNNLISTINYIKYDILPKPLSSQTPTPTGAEGLPTGSNNTTAATSASATSTDESNNINSSTDNGNKVLIGATIGPIMVVALIVGLAFVWYRRRRSRQSTITEKSINTNNYQNVNSASSFTAVPIPAPPTKASPVIHVTALYDFEGKEDTDLSFKKGDIIEVIEKGEGPNDWWVGKIDGKAGEFPGNYVRE